MWTSRSHYGLNYSIAESKSYEGMRLLVPPGKNPPSPLADYKSKGANRSEQTSVVSAMMICCSEMLKNSYPAQVTENTTDLFNIPDYITSSCHCYLLVSI